MGTPTSQPQPRPYESRSKTDSKGREHWKVYMPSARGYAWVELLNLPTDEALRAQILDPDFLPEWKQVWLEDAYRLFRDRENARKRKGRGYASEDELSDPDLFSRRDRAKVLEQQLRDDTSNPEYQAITAIETMERSQQAQKVLAEILLPLTSQQKKYLTLSLGDELSYADIARLEHPNADQAQVNKLADAVRNCVNRALKRIHKKLGQTRPDSTRPEDV